MRWEPVLGGFISLVAVGATILVYWIKAINWSKGHGFCPFLLWGDLDTFAKIIKNVEDARLRRRYRLILWAFYACVFSALMAVLGVGWFASWWPYDR